MPAPILATKLYHPPPRPNRVERTRLLARLKEGLQAGHKLTLVSAGAGFGKTTLLSEWIAGCGRAAAWLSLDSGDNDPGRFLLYFVSALQSAIPGTGEKIIPILLASAGQPQPFDGLLAELINEIAGQPREALLVLDDFHVIESRGVEDTAAFLIENLPPNMHLVIATREDPHLPLSRLRARGQMTEIRAADLRFTVEEAAEFLNHAMELKVSEADIAALERRTEGWIAGLQLAALSLQGQADAGEFIRTFTGSHRFVLDYLAEEVVGRQPEHIQRFLLRTSVLERMCAGLCEAVLPGAGIDGQETLEEVERANLFIVPLDGERKWYRYHHLFGELLRQRLKQAEGAEALAELHRRASEWFETNGLDIEAFQHAAAAGDAAHAERLIEGKGVPLHFRGALAPVLNWLRSLPEETLNARLTLWSAYVSVLLASGHTETIEEKVQLAEKAIAAQGGPEDEKNRDMVGRLAATRALLALSQQNADEILKQGNIALEYLHPQNTPFRISVSQTMAFAHYLRGERGEAKRIYGEALVLLKQSGALVTRVMAMIGMGACLEADNQLHEAFELFGQVLDLVGDIPFPITSEAHRGLADIYYQWNDLEKTTAHLEKCVPLSRQLINTDRSLACEVLRARLMLARGDAAGAAENLIKLDEEARQRRFIFQIPEIAALLVKALLSLGKVEQASAAAAVYDLPLVRAQACLGRGEGAEALAHLEPFLRQAEARNWLDEQLKGQTLRALACQAAGDQAAAMRALETALGLAEAGGFIRIFIDEGQPMEALLREAAGAGVRPEYAGRLLAAFESGEAGRKGPPTAAGAAGLIDPLSERELEVLRLIAEGKSNGEICAQLFLALSTVKGHSQKIFDKLQVKRRTEAVARARELGLI